MRLRRVLAGAAITAGAAAAALAAAPAAGADSPAPWQPFRSEPFTDTDVCPFAVRGDIVADDERVRTLQTYPDGSPREQEFVGLLVIRYTNLDTGASVERNLTGTGWFFFEQDGTIRGHGDGHLGLGVHAVNTDPPPGEYILTGSFSFVINPDNTRDFGINGTVENLCDTLS